VSFLRVLEDMLSTDEFIAGLRRGEMAADHFTIVANLVARDANLANADKGLFLNLASHKAGFRITEEFLASQCTDGIKAIRASLGRLRTAGYVYRGPRTRYPAGAVNAKGKDISGALGPYTWFVTDKPDEIAAILVRYAKEERARNLATETAGQDNMPPGEVVPTTASSERPHGESLPPPTAASDDLGVHATSAGRDYMPEQPVVPTSSDTTFSRVVTTGPNGSSIEEQKKTNKEDQAGGEAPPPGPRRTATAGDVAQVVTDQLELISNHLPACANSDVDAELGSMAEAISLDHPDLGHAECFALAAEQLTTGLDREQAMLAIRRTLAETTGGGARRRRRPNTPRPRSSEGPSVAAGGAKRRAG
jgi:hypothetical protein